MNPTAKLEISVLASAFTLGVLGDALLRCFPWGVNFALWAGLCSAATSLALAIMAPVWGALSDRHGRKVMILRATLVGSSSGSPTTRLSAAGGAKAATSAASGRAGR